MSSTMIGYLVAECGFVVVEASTYPYPSIRDARSAYNVLDSRARGFVEEQSAVVGTPAPSSAQVSTIWIPQETLGIGARIQALFSAAIIAVEICKVYQEEQIKKELKIVSKQITISNYVHAGTSNGLDGFARHVLDFVNFTMTRYTSDGKQHRFFIYHPDTQWHGAFARIRQTETFLHQSMLLGLGHDIFAVFRLMLSARVAQEEDLGDEAKRITFHLLIPSFYSIVIPKSFHIIDAIFPLTIDGEMANTGYATWLNFPQIPAGTLSNIGNLADLPNKSTWKRKLVHRGLVLVAGITGLWGFIPLVTSAAEGIFGPLGLAAFIVSIFALARVLEEIDRWAKKLLWEEPQPALLG